MKKILIVCSSMKIGTTTLTDNITETKLSEPVTYRIKERPFLEDYKSFKMVGIIGFGGFGLSAISEIAKQHLEVIVLEDKKQKEELKINDFLEIKPRNILKDDFDYLPQKVKHRKKRKFF